MKENLSIAPLNNDCFLENALKSQRLAKYEKPGSKFDQAKRRRSSPVKPFFFAVNSCWELRTRGK